VPGLSHPIPLQPGPLSRSHLRGASRHPLRARLAAVAGSAVLAVACGTQNPTPAPSSAPPVTPSPPSASSPSASASGVDYDELVYGSTYRPLPGLEGGTLKIGDPRSGTQLNPLFAGPTVNRALFAATMRTLFLVTGDGHWKPDLATTIPTPTNGMVRPDPSGGGFDVDLELRPGLMWSDGQPATMDDLQYTWRLIEDTPSATVVPGWKVVDRVTVSGPTHATVHFSAPYGDYLSVLGSLFLPAHYFRTVSATDAPTKLYPFSPEIAKAVTIGPFKYSTVSANSVGLVRDDDWRGPFQSCDRGACVDGLTYRMFPNDKTGLIDAFQKGDIDVALGLMDTDEAAVAAGDTGIAIIDSAWSYEHFDMNEAGIGPGQGHPALRDIVVRRAIAQAIDRKSLFDAVRAAGLASPPDVNLVACTNATPTNYWQLPDPGCPPLDVEAANAALDAAGYRRGADGIRIDPRGNLPLVFQHCTTSSPFHEIGAQLIKQDLTRIGIKLDLNMVDSRAVMFAAWGDVGAGTRCNLAHGNFDTAEFSYSDRFYPYDNYYYPYDSEQIPTQTNGGRGLNFIRFADPAVDAGIDRLGSALSAADQVTAAYDLQRAYVSEVPEVALYYRAEVRGISGNVRNFIMHPGTTLGDGADTWNVEDWWIGD